VALNIKNAAVERLAAEVAELAGETKTEAVRRALEERRERLALAGGVMTRDEMVAFLEREVWSKVPAKVRGKLVTKREREEILGYGPEGA
jgi:antitoxin VapB